MYSNHIDLTPAQFLGVRVRYVPGDAADEEFSAQAGVVEDVVDYRDSLETGGAEYGDWLGHLDISEGRTGLMSRKSSVGRTIL